MTHVTIALPEDLMARAKKTAAESGASLDDLVRDSLERYLRKFERPWSEDSFFADRRTYDGSVPADLSERHDDYLYGDKD
jgi:hypothetical protein